MTATALILNSQFSKTSKFPNLKSLIVKTLSLILGPTAAGKTAFAINLAQQLHTEIVSCDSRQFYQELNIGVARPSLEELAAVPHHFIASRSVSAPYNVFTYQQDALQKLDLLFQKYDNVVAVGGSSLYIQALCNGISLMPDPTPELRQQLQQKLHDEGIESLRAMLRQLDPDYYQKVDLANGVRIQRALEVCLTAGKPYSQLIAQPLEPRPFQVHHIVVQRDTQELRQRIDQRVDLMFQQGLEDEARNLYHLRHLTPLNTVGYKEFFSLWNQCGSPVILSQQQTQQIAQDIKLNTWHYAKKQLTWIKKMNQIIRCSDIQILKIY